MWSRVDSVWERVPDRGAIRVKAKTRGWDLLEGQWKDCGEQGERKKQGAQRRKIGGEGEMAAMLSSHHEDLVCSVTGAALAESWAES